MKNRKKKVGKSGRLNDVVRKNQVKKAETYTFYVKECRNG